jgi:hypothetical protein
MSPGFSFDRFKQVTYRFLVLNKKSYSIAFGGALIGLYAFWLFQLTFDNQNVKESTQLIFVMGVMLYQIGGLILTSAIFNELQLKESASQILTLPATSAEKLCSAWVVSYLLFTILAFITIALVLGLTTISAGLILEDSSLGMVDSNFNDFTNFALTYLVFNSIFLLGAVYFKGKNFLKTGACIVLFTFGFTVLIITIANLIAIENFSMNLSSFLFFSSGTPALVLLSQLIVDIPIATLFIILSYYRLKNRQVV